MQPPVNERPKPRGPYWVLALFLLVIVGAAVAVWAPWAAEDGNMAAESTAPEAPAPTASSSRAP